MMLTIAIENDWCANVRGIGAWQLCAEAGHRKPAYSNATKSWVVSAATARKVAELAARIDGLNVVITDPKLAGAPTCSPVAVSEPAEEGLW